MQGKQSRLCSKAEEARRKGKFHDTGDIIYGETSPIDEAPRLSIDRGHDHRDKGKPCAANGKGCVFSCRVHALVVVVIGHERDRHQGEHFKKYIHGGDIRGKRHPKSHSVSHDIEGEELVLLPCFLHVFKGIKHHKGPHHRDHPRKKAGKTIHFEIDGKIPCKAVDHHRFSPHCQQGGKDQNGCDADDRFRIPVSSAVFHLLLHEQQPESSHDRKQDRDQQKYGTQFYPPSEFETPELFRYTTDPEAAGRKALPEEPPRKEASAEQS